MVDVPFERPASFGTRAELTDAEFAVAQERAQTDVSPPRRSLGEGGRRYVRRDRTIR
jgi:hypothetical protein